MPLERLHAVRYAAPLREGGSLPAVVETAEDGMWVVKFLGAGQGARALVAEIVVGELARRLGLPVPELALVDVPSSFGRTERDPEIQDLLKASVGANLGMRFVEGALNFDPVAAADLVTPETAAEIVWLDAFTTNIDRTARNPNMLVADERIWLIDHGAALYFHHNWKGVTPQSMQRPFPAIGKHILLSLAGSIVEADDRLAGRLDEQVVAEVLELVPDELLMHAPEGVTPAFEDAAANRAAYVDALGARLEERAFVDVAERLRTEGS